MKFGKLLPDEINGIDFTLPADAQFVTHVLPGQPATAPKAYVGCAKWGRKEWLGKIYPVGTKESAFLSAYVRHFNTIELNATHYKIYGPETIAKWADQASGTAFRFCPKVPQLISHYSDLSSEKAHRYTDEFLTGIQAFGEHLGPVFLQLSERYAPSRQGALFQYLRQWPRDLACFLEVRHHSWFADQSVSQALFSLLHELGIGAVITDTAGRRDVVHMQLTVPKAMIRFGGNHLHPTDYSRIDAWVDRIDSWMQQGLQEVYFFMHQHDETDTLELCAYTVERLNAVCGLDVPMPQFIRSTGSLFD